MRLLKVLLRILFLFYVAHFSSLAYAKAIPECGVKTYITKEDHKCGAKEARSKHCGVQSYTKKASAACGLNSNAKQKYIPIPGHCRKGDNSRPDENCVDCPKGYTYVGMAILNEQPASSPVIMPGTLAITASPRFDHLRCFGDPLYATCAHKDHGVDLYKKCNHEKHGFNTCSLKEFGVAEYHDCAQYSRDEILAWINTASPFVDYLGEKLAKSAALLAHHDLQQRNMYCAMEKLVFSPLAAETFADLSEIYNTSFGVGFEEQSFDCQSELLVNSLSAEQDESNLLTCSSEMNSVRCYLKTEYLDALKDLNEFFEKAHSMSNDVVASQDTTIKATLENLMGSIESYF